MPTPQTLKNHARFNPLFHFTIIPLLILNLIFSIYITIHRWPAYQHEHLWWIVMAVVFILMAGDARGSALKAQDRIVRLEERLRLATLLPPHDCAHINDLTTRQLIALRSDCCGSAAGALERTRKSGLLDRMSDRLVEDHRRPCGRR